MTENLRVSEAQIIRLCRSMDSTRQVLEIQRQGIRRQVRNRSGSGFTWRIRK
jgi:hypothetical protein